MIYMKLKIGLNSIIQQNFASKSVKFSISLHKLNHRLEILLEQAKISDASRKFEFAKFSSRHGHVDTTESRGEYKEDTERYGEFPPAKRKTIEFRSFT